MTSDPTRTDAPPLHPLAAGLLAIVAYLVVAFGAMQVSLPPLYASPLFPSAGIGLLAVLLYGPRMAVAPGIAALISTLLFVPPVPAAPWFPLVIGVGAGLQALVGERLVRRWVGTPLALEEPRDIALFLALTGPVTCLINASLGHAALFAVGTVPVDELFTSLVTWWAGDALGVLIAVPILLSLLAAPRDAWRPRRTTVALPLAVVTALLALGTAQVASDDAARVAQHFARDAANATGSVRARLDDPLHALEAMRGVYIASEDVTGDELQRAARSWIEQGPLQAIGWSARLTRAEVPAFEARARAEGPADYRVFDRADAVPMAPDDPLVAIRYITPLERNRGALGVNARSIAAARAAIDAATASGRPAATAGLRLTQSAEGSPPTGIVIYQALYRTTDTPPAAERAAALRGVVFVTVRMEDMIASLRDRLPAYLALCIVDTATGQALAGPAGCAQPTPGNLAHSERLSYAGRDWELRATAPARAVPDTRAGSAWRFAIVGLFATAMLGALLLVVTGRTRRIEAAVAERTAALQSEVQERELAQAALRESERRFRNILNTVPIGILYSDIDGRVRQANPRFRELTGFSEVELKAMTEDGWTHPDDRADDAALIATLVEGSVPLMRRDKRIVTKDGRTLWVKATTSLLRDGRGKARRIVAVMEDITEHLRLQEAEKARELAEAANRAKSDFLSRMSHELRTPLNAMLGFAQLLELDQRQPLAPSQKPWVGQIQQAGWHLLEMINDVLDLSRIESGNLRLSTEEVDTARVIAQTLALVESDADRRGIRVTTTVEPGAAMLRGDVTRVKQILTNLLTNAVKYNVDGGQVQVVARAEGADSVQIAVTDTGLGMDDAQLASLFQPFNRLGRERTNAPGTGIGLVISRRLAELMGGALDATSASGEGTTFRLTLPRAATDEPPDSVHAKLGPAEADYHQRIVHYVEDNETNVEVMRGVLAQRPQVRLDVSLTGLDGLARIRANRPDLILLDMHLPDIAGLELLRHLKADPDTATIPVVVVSADAVSAQIQTALDAGALRYLTKPVGVTELLEVVDAVLDNVETQYG
jgi:PAS domain S-box-containing protein